MFFHDSGKNCRKGRAMSSAAFSWAEALVEREQRAGLTKPEATRRAASRAHVSPGQLEGLLRGRVKDPKIGTVERIRFAFIAATTREIERLSHELSKARAAGLDPDCREVRAARAAMARLSQALGE